MITRNRLGVIRNAYQGKYKKILTVCSAGCLRSPTAAHILSSPPFNLNTRCAGTEAEYAIIKVEEGLVAWADMIIVMERYQVKVINDMQESMREDDEGFEYKPVISLDIHDNYGYRDPELVRIMNKKFLEIFPQETPEEKVEEPNENS